MTAHELAYEIYAHHRQRSATAKRSVALPAWESLSLEQRSKLVQRAKLLQRQYYRIEAREIPMTL